MSLLVILLRTIPRFANPIDSAERYAESVEARTPKASLIEDPCDC